MIEDKPTQPGFDEVVTRYYQPLYQFAYSLARAEADACDLTQQTFYIWARKGHQLRDHAKIKTWLFTTLYREFLKTTRHNGRFPHDELDPNAPDLPAITADAIRRLEVATLMQALTEVDEVYRVPLALFYLEDNSYKEIAEILAIPIGTVQSRIARGKAQLQQRLRAHE